MLRVDPKTASGKGRRTRGVQRRCRAERGLRDRVEEAHRPRRRPCLPHRCPHRGRQGLGLVRVGVGRAGGQRDPRGRLDDLHCAGARGADELLVAAVAGRDRVRLARAHGVQDLPWRRRVDPPIEFDTALPGDETWRREPTRPDHRHRVTHRAAVHGELHGASRFDAADLTSARIPGALRSLCAEGDNRRPHLGRAAIERRSRREDADAGTGVLSDQYVVALDRRVPVRVLDRQLNEVDTGDIERGRRGVAVEAHAGDEPLIGERAGAESAKWLTRTASPVRRRLRVRGPRRRLRARRRRR